MILEYCTSMRLRKDGARIALLCMKSEARILAENGRDYEHDVFPVKEQITLDLSVE